MLPSTSSAMLIVDCKFRYRCLVYPPSGAHSPVSECSVHLALPDTAPKHPQDFFRVSEASGFDKQPFRPDLCHVDSIVVIINVLTIMSIKALLSLQKLLSKQAHYRHRYRHWNQHWHSGKSHGHNYRESRSHWSAFNFLTYAIVKCETAMNVINKRIICCQWRRLCTSF